MPSNLIVTLFPYYHDHIIEAHTAFSQFLNLSSGNYSIRWSYLTLVI